MYFETYPEYNPTQIYHSLPKAYRSLDYNCEFGITENKQASVWMNEDYDWMNEDYGWMNEDYGWMDEDYDRNELYREDLIHTTQNGLCVRSKSESIIAGMLETYGIPFRYEAILSVWYQTIKYIKSLTIQPRRKSI